MFLHKNFNDLKNDFAIKNGDLINETTLNNFQFRLKKELDDCYNQIQTAFSKPALEFSKYIDYEIGEIVNFENQNYIKTSNTQTNSIFPNSDWRIITSAEFQKINENSVLLKNNQIPYDPELLGAGETTNHYHPTTLKYVNDKIESITSNKLTSELLGSTFNTAVNALEINPDEIKKQGIYKINDGYLIVFINSQLKISNNLEIFKRNLIDNVWNEWRDQTEIIVDNLTTADSKLALSANQGKILKKEIDSINKILKSNDVDLDEFQEIVDYIKSNKKLINSTQTQIQKLETSLQNAETNVQNMLAIKNVKNSILTNSDISENENSLEFNLTQKLDFSDNSEVENTLNFQLPKYTLEIDKIENENSLDFSLTLNNNLSLSTSNVLFSIPKIGDSEDDNSKDNFNLENIIDFENYVDGKNIIISELDGVKNLTLDKRNIGGLQIPIFLQNGILKSCEIDFSKFMLVDSTETIAGVKNFENITAESFDIDDTTKSKNLINSEMLKNYVNNIDVGLKNLASYNGEVLLKNNTNIFELDDNSKLEVANSLIIGTKNSKIKFENSNILISNSSGNDINISDFALKSDLSKIINDTTRDTISIVSKYASAMIGNSTGSIIFQNTNNSGYFLLNSKNYIKLVTSSTFNISSQKGMNIINSSSGDIVFQNNNANIKLNAKTLTFNNNEITTYNNLKTPRTITKLSDGATSDLITFSSAYTNFQSLIFYFTEYMPDASIRRLQINSYELSHVLNFAKTQGVNFRLSCGDISLDLDSTTSTTTKLIVKSNIGGYCCGVFGVNY